MDHDKLTSFTADLAHVPASSRDEQPHVVDTAGGLFARVMGADWILPLHMVGASMQKHLIYKKN